MASISSRRLQKELKEITTEGCPVGTSAHYLKVFVKGIYVTVFPGITLVEANDFEKWLFSIEVMGESQYQVRRVNTRCHCTIGTNYWSATGRKIHADVPISSTVPHRVSCSPIFGRSDASIAGTPSTFYPRHKLMRSCSFK